MRVGLWQGRKREEEKWESSDCGLELRWSSALKGNGSGVVGC